MCQYSLRCKSIIESRSSGWLNVKSGQGRTGIRLKDDGHMHDDDGTESSSRGGGAEPEPTILWVSTIYPEHN